ncbi:hypothetical protein HDU93_001532 [Gonapodya sp. JEL0774]|nr:hypothetical protein HDU93_001532 [Gonapodya sp. JEL0774]
MESFRTRYVDACSKFGIEPIASLLNKLKTSTGDAASNHPHTLDISGQPLTVKAAAAFAAGLQDDVVFTNVNLADGFLSDDGCIVIAGALKTNKAAKSMDLRANNIRADGAIALGQMLKVNSTLKSLSLEWNCIGLWDSGIKALGDALTVNQTLVELDLRNNRIAPQAAQCLALSLKHNNSLRRLDLRWNNAGLIGGRAFVDALKWNMVLTELELAGNEVPEDITRTLLASLERNRERHSKEATTRANAQHLSSAIQNISQQHSEALVNLTSRLESSEERQRSLVERLESTTSELGKWQGICKQLESRLAIVEKERDSCQGTLISERNENRERINRLQGDIVTEREAKTRVEEEVKTACRDLTKRVLTLEAELSEALMKVEVTKREKSLLVEDFDRGKERERALLGAYEDKIRQLEGTISRKQKEYDVELEVSRDKIAEERRRVEELVVEAEKRGRQEMDHLRVENEKRLFNARSQVDSLQNKLDAANQQRANLLSEHELALKRCNREKSDLQEAASRLAAESSAAQQDVGRWRARAEELEKQSALLRAKLVEQTGTEERERSLAKRVSELHSENEMLRDRLKTKEVEAATLRGVLEDEEQTRLQIASLLTKPRLRAAASAVQ